MDETLYNGAPISQPTVAGSLGMNGLEYSSDGSYTTMLYEPLPNWIQTNVISSFENAAPQDAATAIGMQDLLSQSPELYLLDEPIWPPPTPDLAPQWGPGSNLYGYHTQRADWHGNAETFHRAQLEQLNEIRESLNPLSPSDPSLYMPNPCTSIALHEEIRAHANSRGSKEKAKKKATKSRTQPETSRRVTASGSIQKIDAASSKELPPHITKAILSDYKQHADVSELHPRILRKLNFDSKSVYNQLEMRPSAWGPWSDKRQNNRRFNYNEFGELEPGDLLTVEDMRTFLFSHPLHDRNGAHNPKEGLILWIQRNPADSKLRFGHPSSARCRFKKCIAAHNLIGQGQNRVTFDELSCRGENFDPMHNAGYVHLYCLERLMDFPVICSTLQVKVEDRQLPHEPGGRNRMLLSSNLEKREAERFIRNCEKGKVSTSYPHSEISGQPYTYKGTLCNKLCIKKVKAEPERVKRARVERGDRLSTLTHHLGDLAMETKHRTQSRLAKNQVRSRASTPYSELAGLESEDDEDQDRESSDDSYAEAGSPDRPPMPIANMASSSSAFTYPTFLQNGPLNLQATRQPYGQVQANFQTQPNYQAQSLYHTMTPTSYPHTTSQAVPQEWQHSTQENKADNEFDYLFEDSVET